MKNKLKQIEKEEYNLDDYDDHLIVADEKHDHEH